MKTTVEKRKPEGVLDHISLALTTFGVGYFPGAPGTYGSAIGLLIYCFIGFIYMSAGYAIGSGGGFDGFPYVAGSIISVVLTSFIWLGIWASNRSIPLLGNEDPSEAVVDEVMGQLVTFLFVPFGLTWPFILAGFLLFRLFDIWKPYPIRNLEILPGGLGICADDIVAGVYAGICLAVGYAVFLAI